jgi:chemotaxis signal transduction protein
MSGQRKKFDWQRIHAELERRLSRLGSSYDSDQARVQALLRQRSVRLSVVPNRDDTVSLSRILVFGANGERYGLALESAHEIYPLSQVTALPGSSRAVLGIVNWRGEFAIVFHPAGLLDISHADAPARYAIVLRGGEPRVALAAQRLEGIARTDFSKLQPGEQLRPSVRDLFRGLTEDSVLVLAEERLQARLAEELRAA